MKFLYTALFLSFTISIGSSQNQKVETRIEIPKDQEPSSTFKLFPSQNYWTFIKLNTRNGKMWQVHFTVDEEGASGELILNPTTLVKSDKEVDNRFTLYPTENMYNFLLLDQINGNVYQVQWSMEEKYRGVLPIY